MIALGIGATATIFSVVNGVLLKPLPWPNSAQLIRVSETRRGGTVSLAPELTNATYLAWLEHAKTIDGLAGDGETTAILNGPTGAEPSPAGNVPARLFPPSGRPAAPPPPAPPTKAVSAPPPPAAAPA